MSKVQDEEELCGQRKLLDAVFQPEVRFHRADVQLLSLSKEEDPPEQQEWSPSLDQQDPAEPPHIKEEQEDLWTSQEGEQLPGLQEADGTKVPFTPVPVKSEEDEEKPQSSQLHQRLPEHMETGAAGEDCGGPGPARNSDPDTHLQPAAHDETSDSEPETDDSCDWEETREPPSGSNPLQNNSRHKYGEKRFSCSECGNRFSLKSNLNKHMRIHSGDKPFSCSVCSKIFSRKEGLTDHMTIHTGEKPFSCSVCGRGFIRLSRLKNHQCVGRQSSQLHQRQTEEDRDDQECNAGKPPSSSSECAASFGLKEHLQEHDGNQPGEKPFSCSVCKKTFQWKGAVVRHMIIHTGKKPFGCSVCGKGFTQSSHLTRHLRVHTGEKPFACSVCKRSFSDRRDLSQHMRIHTGEKPFSCSVCGKGFAEKGNQTKHMRIHTGEKPFSCSFCGKEFTQNSTLNTHLRVHTGEKPFSCSVCKRSFSFRSSLPQHMRIHTGEKPFSCSVCDKSFTRLAHMKVHKCAGESSGSK